jgi:hypothetical protein
MKGMKSERQNDDMPVLLSENYFIGENIWKEKACFE